MKLSQSVYLALFGSMALLLPCALAGDDAGPGGRVFRARLGGYQEVPSVSTEGRGRFGAKLTGGGSTIDYVLEYSGLEGAEVRFAHIHFGQLGVNGGVIVFLCDNTGGAPAGTPACPASGKVEGTLDADDVQGPSSQGIAAGELDELVRAMRRGVTYVNLHTDLFPAGEIRGQIFGGRGPHGGDDDDGDDE